MTMNNRCIYGLDRVLSLVLGRPWGIDDQDITLELPLNVSDDSLRDLAPDEEERVPPSTGLTAMGCFIEFTRLSQLAGQCFRVARYLDRGLSYDEAHVARIRYYSSFNLVIHPILTCFILAEASWVL